MIEEKDNISTALQSLEVAEKAIITALVSLGRFSPDNALEHSIFNGMNESIRLLRVAQNHLDFVKKGWEAEAANTALEKARELISASEKSGSENQT